MEAKQRAENIAQQAEEDAAKERNNLINREKEKIDHDYTLKMKAELVKAKM